MGFPKDDLDEFLEWGLENDDTDDLGLDEENWEAEEDTLHYCRSNLFTVRTRNTTC